MPCRQLLTTRLVYVWMCEQVAPPDQPASAISPALAPPVPLTHLHVAGVGRRAVEALWRPHAAAHHLRTVRILCSRRGAARGGAGCVQVKRQLSQTAGVCVPLQR